MIEQIEIIGGSSKSLRAKIVGGANMFGWQADSKKSIGERNVEAARTNLRTLNIPLEAEEVGGNEGRSVEYHAATGRILIRNDRGEEHTI